MGKKIYIGGTGRSGTTLLYRILRNHNAIYAFNSEMRFIVDPRGLVSLYSALTNYYSIPQARNAVSDFEKLMLHDTVNRFTSPYAGFQFKKWFGSDYEFMIEKFIEDILVSEFKGTDITVDGGCFYNLSSPLWRVLSPASRIFSKFSFVKPKNFWPHAKIKTPQYFENPSELAFKMGSLVDNLFSSVANKNGFENWCEKTPMNMLHYDFLHEIHPDAYFINVHRDPRGIAQSMMTKSWADSDAKGVALTLKQVLKRYRYIKGVMLDQGASILELKLEDLAERPDFYISKVCHFIDEKEDFSQAHDIKKSRSDYWKDDIDEKVLKIFNSILSEEIEKLGYKV